MSFLFFINKFSSSKTRSICLHNCVWRRRWQVCFMFFHEWMDGEQRPMSHIVKLTYQKNFNCYQCDWTQSKSRAPPIDSRFSRCRVTQPQLSEILDELVGVVRLLASPQWNEIHDFLSHSNDVQVLMTTRWDNENGNSSSWKPILICINFAAVSRLFLSFEGVAKMVMDVRVERRWSRRAILYQ
jgi:hypothetical protein